MKQNLTKTRISKGFTLIEIMVALTIVSVGVVAISASVAQSARNQSHLQDKMLATWVADNRFAYLKSLDEPLKNSQGQEIMGSQTWFYEESVELTNNINIQKVTISIYHQDGQDKLVGTYIGYIPSVTRQIIELE